MEHDLLKSAMLGGYDKESVLKYIESLMETAREQADKLGGDLSQQQALNANLAEQNRKLLTQYHELADSVQGISRNMDTLLTENKQLTAQVERYRNREDEVTALRLEMETEANDHIQEAQAQAWSMEEESRRALLEAEARAAALLVEAEAEQERIAHVAELRRSEASARLENELWALVDLARSIDILAQEAEATLSSRAKKASKAALPVKPPVPDA